MVKPEAELKTGASRRTTDIEVTTWKNGTYCELMSTRTRKSRPNLPSPQSTSPSPNTTPKKSVKTKKDSEGNASRTIHSFFNAATQRLQQQSETKGAPTANESNLLDDVIEDDPAEQHLSRKRAYQFIDNKSKSGSQNRLSAPSSKFLRKADGARVPVPSSGSIGNVGAVVVDARPWSEKYAPQNLEELAIHKRKVLDVKEWLEAVLARNTTQRLLILKGATGSGKTITVSLLSQALSLDIVEWRNPGSNDYTSYGHSSSSAQFDEFLFRGGAFNALDFGEQSSPSAPEQHHATVIDRGSQNQLLLVEEYPAFGSQTSNSIEAFRASVLRYVATGSPAQARMSAINPLVMIISESLVSNASSQSENFTAHRLFGPDILNHANVRVIEFNPVAPTFITKALNTIIQKHSRSSARTVMPKSDVIRKLAEMGDIRNAVSTLEYYWLEESATGVAKATATATKKPGASKKLRSQALDTASSLSRISLRESTLGLFHAVGKVVYNKRTLPTDQSSAVESHLPIQLSVHGRTHPSEVDIDELANSTGTDHSTFLYALHENYLMSCQSASADNEAALNVITGVLDSLSDAEILLNHESSSDLYYRAHEKQTQVDLAFNVGVRGTLFNLPHPVRRVPFPGVPARSGRVDAHRMFYPISLKLWKIKEENLGTIEWLVRKAMAGTLIPSSPARTNSKPSKPAVTEVSQPGRVTSVRVNSGGQSCPSAKAANSNEAAHSFGPTSIGSGDSARHEMVLERLPYLAKIIRGMTASTSMDIPIRQIHAVTKLTGIEALTGAGDEDEAGEGNARVSRSTLSFSGRGSDLRRFGSRKASSFPLNKPEVDAKALDVERLVLSDDDIEDE